jgi:hypothetical protein
VRLIGVPGRRGRRGQTRTLSEQSHGSLEPHHARECLRRDPDAIAKASRELTLREINVQRDVADRAPFFEEAHGGAHAEIGPMSVRERASEEVCIEERGDRSENALR